MEDFIDILSFDIPKKLVKETSKKGIIDQFSAINLYVFEDPSIDHKERKKRQQELLDLSIEYKSVFSSAYIFNLMSQTEIQLGNLGSSLDFLLQAKQMWKKVQGDNINSLNGLILCYADIGNVYLKMGFPNKSMKHMETALELLDDNNDDLFVPYFKVHYYLHSLYAELGFMSKSFEMINKCLLRLKNYPFNDVSRSYVYKIPAMASLAELYINDKNMHKAIDALQESLKLCKKIDDVIYMPQLYQKLGDAYLKIKDYKKSEKYLNKSLSLYSVSSSDAKVVSVSISIAKLFMEIEDYKSAEKTLLDILEISQNKKLNLNLMEIYKYLGQIYEVQNDIENSYEFNKKHIDLIAEYYNSKSDALIDDKKRTVRQLSEQIEEKNKIKSQDTQSLNKKFEVRNKTSKILFSIRENNILKSLKNDIENLLINLNNLRDSDINRVIKKISGHIKSEEDWDQFELMFEQIHENFTHNLKSVSPALTVKQIRFCMFIKMGMDKEDICNLLNVTDRAVEQQRYRIRKKLMINSKLDEFISSL